MSDQPPQRPPAVPAVVIERVRITGLAGPAPSADAVRHAIAEALRGGPGAAGHAALRSDARLAEAAHRVAATIRKNVT